LVRRIAAECTFIDERGGVGIHLEPAAVSQIAVASALILRVSFGHIVSQRITR